MTTVVESIVRRTRADLEVRKARTPIGTLRQRCRATTLSFADALRTDTLSLIAEIKPRSPSRGPLRANPDPEAIARAYQRYASAISVLCDEPYFGGGYAMLERVRASTDLPLLAKDFVVDPYQVYEARVHGGDAILLMVSVLPERELSALLGLARELGMEALVETHDDDELEVALGVGATVIGVNSRDLRTLTINLDRARERLRRVPSGCVRVAESGLDRRQDVDAVREIADAALIGSSLMSSPDPAVRIEELGWKCR